VGAWRIPSGGLGCSWCVGLDMRLASTGRQEYFLRERPQRFVPVGSSQDLRRSRAWLFLRVSERLGFQYDASMLPDSMDYIQEELDLEASQNPSFQITKPPTKTVVAGTYAIEYTCSYNTPEGVRIIETAYLVPQGSIAYVLDIQSASAAWTANRATLEAIVASFRLGPAQ
jgi:hypothetical protein